MNVELLRRVKDHILEEPRRLRMSRWLENSDTSPCGTVGCIAGWTYMLTDGKEKRATETASIMIGMSSIGTYAMDKLEITLDQAFYLFHVIEWPLWFQTRFEDGNLEQRAIVVAEVIEDFIKKNTK